MPEALADILCEVDRANRLAAEAAFGDREALREYVETDPAMDGLDRLYCLDVVNALIEMHSDVLTHFGIERRPIMFLADSWTDYEVLDTGDGEKLERWGDIILRRPDPQTIWPKAQEKLWKSAQAHYHRSERGGGEWEFLKKLPERWTVSHGDLTFYVRPTGFKHTGLFPEQAANWLWMDGLIRKDGRKDLKVLNLFGYTGGATLACAAAGAHVTHVDAAKGMVLWAKENRELSRLPEDRFRWIVEDALRFVQRELRRGNSYDGILMDPPSYGRGPPARFGNWKTNCTG